MSDFIPMNEKLENTVAPTTVYAPHVPGLLSLSVKWPGEERYEAALTARGHTTTISAMYQVAARYAGLRDGWPT